MKKYLAPIVLAVPLTLAACSAETAGPDPATSGAPPQDESRDYIEGEVGFRHGVDCVAYDDCNIRFTVEKIDTVEECLGSAGGDASEAPATKPVSITVLLETTAPVIDTGRDPGQFPAWAKWSTIDDEGVSQPLEYSMDCYHRDHEPWGGLVTTGDKVRLDHTTDIPLESTELRLTDTYTGSRWVFPLDQPA